MKFLGEKAGHLKNEIADVGRSVGKALSLVVLFVAALMSCAQSPAPVLHVTAARDWAPTDPAPVSRVKCYVITGTVGSVRYTAEQLFTGGVNAFK
jgi:hypothetical protein